MTLTPNQSYNHFILRSNALLLQPQLLALVFFKTFSFFLFEMCQLPFFTRQGVQSVTDVIKQKQKSGYLLSHLKNMIKKNILSLKNSQQLQLSPQSKQGTLTEGEGSEQLTFLYQVVQNKCFCYLNILLLLRNKLTY